MEDDLVVNQQHPGGGNPDDYYDEDDFEYDHQRDMDDSQQAQAAGGSGNRGKPMTLAEEKEALKRKLKEIGTRKKKPPKYKKEPKDILADPKQSAGPDSQEQKDGRAQRKKQGNFYLNDFNFISTLGTGTFGRVRLVKHRDDPAEANPLALKCLKKSEIIRLKQIEHVKSEKAILERINHPFIVNLKGTFQSPTHVFMLLDYACGGELFTLLRREGRFANDVALFFAVEIILAFEYLHSSDIAYRDLKPENLLIDIDGHVKITDFGFAKEVPDKTYTLCGTPEYLAPEIIQSKGHNKNVDWWALGVLIFEMLAGYPPFYDDNPIGIYQKIMDGYYEFPPHIEPKARDLIRSFLCADRSLRMGCSPSGPEEIKNHKWFRGVDWQMVLKRQVPPPWVPKVKNQTDTQYFDRYAESTQTPSLPDRDQQRHFNDF